MNDMGPSRSSPAAPPLPYASVLAALGEGVVVQAEGGEILYANPRARAQLGLEMAVLPALVELPWIGGEAPPVGVPGIPVHDVFESGRSVDARVVGLRPARGGRRWFALSATPLWEEDGADLPTAGERRGAARSGDDRPRAAVVTIRDVTSVWRDRQRLARQARFRSGLVRLLDGSLSGSLGAGFDRTVLEVAVEVIPDAQCGLLLRREGDRYLAAAAVGHDLEQLVGVPFEVVDPAVERGTVVVSRRGHEPPLRPLDAARAGKAGPASDVQARMVVPVHVGGRTVAALALENLERIDAFDAEAGEAGRILGAALATLWQRFHLEVGSREERERVEYVALHDPLTDLPNRTLATDRLERAMSSALRSGRPLALMFLDLDDFGRVNQAFGTERGDQLLVKVAQRLRRGLREADTVARWGGDQLALLATELGSADDAVRVAQKALSLLDEPFDIGGRPLMVHATVGVELYPHQASTAEELLRSAEMALYRAKIEAKGGWRFFTSDLNEGEAERRRLEEELRRALAGSGLELHFQPRVDLATLRVTGVEALVRWRRGPGPLVPPRRLLEAGEQAGVADELAQAVLRLACGQAAYWRHGRIDVPVAINLSGANLQRVDLPAAFADALSAFRLPAGALEVEVPESAALQDTDSAQRTLDALRRLGVPVSLDDVGGATSSLAQLGRWAPDRLKIDGALVAGLDGEASASAAAVRAAVALGHSLGCTVVAKGVETPVQRRALRAFGCDEAQGYLFARPAPAERIEPILARGRIDPGARP